jgi:hypothetical protein
VTLYRLGIFYLFGSCNWIGFPEAFKPYPTNKPNPAIQVLPVNATADSGKSVQTPSDSSSSGSDFKAAPVFAALTKQIAGLFYFCFFFE